MPTYKFEAMDTAGEEVKDEIEATNEEEAQQKIKQMGYFVTKLVATTGGKGKGKKKKVTGYKKAKRHRGDGLSVRRHPGGGRHFDLHHGGDHPEVREDLPRVRPETSRPDAIPHRRLDVVRDLLVVAAVGAARHLAPLQIDPPQPGRELCSRPTLALGANHWANH